MKKFMFVNRKGPTARSTRSSPGGGADRRHLRPGRRPGLPDDGVYELAKGQDTKAGIGMKEPLQKTYRALDGYDVEEALTVERRIDANAASPNDLIVDVQNAVQRRDGGADMEEQDVVLSVLTRRQILAEYRQQVPARPARSQDCLRLAGDARRCSSSRTASARRHAPAAASARLAGTMKRLKVYALGPDLAARGIADRAGRRRHRRRDYAGFIDLIRRITPTTRRSTDSTRGERQMPIKPPASPTRPTRRLSDQPRRLERGRRQRHRQDRERGDDAQPLGLVVSFLRDYYTSSRSPRPCACDQGDRQTAPRAGQGQQPVPPRTVPLRTGQRACKIASLPNPTVLRLAGGTGAARVVSHVGSPSPAIALLFYAATWDAGRRPLALRIRLYLRPRAALSIPDHAGAHHGRRRGAPLAREVALVRACSRANKWTWGLGWLFHATLLLVLLRHVRYFRNRCGRPSCWWFSTHRRRPSPWPPAWPGLWARAACWSTTCATSPRRPTTRLALLLAHRAGSRPGDALIAHTDIVALKAFVLRADAFRLASRCPPIRCCYVHPLLLVMLLMVVFPISKAAARARDILQPDAQPGSTTRARRARNRLGRAFWTNKRMATAAFETPKLKPAR